MMRFCYYSIIFLTCVGCAKQPSLPENSVFNVTSVLNDTVWYGTGKVLRIKEPAQELKDIRQFNLVVFTDIDYPGSDGGPNPNTNNGCLDPECTRTQSLVIFNIPLKKGKFSIAKLNKKGIARKEYATHSYVGNAGGLMKRYLYRGLRPGWIRVTSSIKPQVLWKDGLLFHLAKIWNFTLD